MVVNSMNVNTSSDVLCFIDVNNDGLRSPLDALLVVNRLNRGEQGAQHGDPSRNGGLPNLPTEIRSIDGTNNNLANPELGSTGEALLRIAEADYADGISAPAGADRPGAREISNLLSETEPEGTRNDRGLSAFLYEHAASGKWSD